MTPRPPSEPSPHAAAARAELARLRAEAEAAGAQAGQSAEDFAREAEAALERYPIEGFAPGDTLRPKAVAKFEPKIVALPTPAPVTGVEAAADSVIVPLPRPARRMPVWGWAAAAAVVLAGGLLLRPMLFRGDDQLRDGPLRVTSDGRIADPANLPAELIAAVEGAIRTRSAAAVLGESGLMRGGGSLTDLPRTALDLAIAGGNALIGSAEAVLLQPALGATIEEDRPEFRWRRAAEATGYIVRLEQSDGTLVAESPQLGAAQESWRPPSALARGEIYRWSVLAQQPGGAERKASPSAVVKVLSAAELASLQQLRRTHGRSHLILAAAYARLGMESEARREIAELARKEPDSALARELAASLRSK